MAFTAGALETRRPVVAVVQTGPGTVLADIGRVMKLAGYESALPKATPIGLKTNISWQVWYPGCSTTPWQLDGVLRTFIQDGYPREQLLAIHGSTTVDSQVGEVNNRHRVVLEQQRVQAVHASRGEVEWIRYEPRGRMIVLDRICPEGIMIPKLLLGRSMMHLPTLKTHTIIGASGAMENALGALPGGQRYWAHSAYHAGLVDLLRLQQEIHPGLFAVTDGTIAGDGPGPRAMLPRVANLLLASRDLVAIDAVAAKLMGFEPLSLKYLRLAHDAGLGCGDPREIELVGDDVSEVNLRFDNRQDTLVSRGEKLVWRGALRPLEGLLLNSPIGAWTQLAARLYYDGYWYPLIGRRRARAAVSSGWGRLFLTYPPKAGAASSPPIGVDPGASGA